MIAVMSAEYLTMGRLKKMLPAGKGYARHF